ncbi:MAG: BREX system ATP-binding domain-containing protein, partial [Leptolyngbyaceae bacterium]|nr:BREX system ATP-binding domain-containing protein [Leptolyngbyaceae bacterium]
MERYDATRRRAVAVVESLRAGIPTRTSTKELPDLRASLTSLIHQDLTQFAAGKRPPGRLAWGPYGQGKTHALTTVEHVALDLGFVVSRVSLSREVSCHHLFNFYGRVAAAIRTPDSKILGMTRALNRKRADDLLGTPLKAHDRYIHPLPAIILEDYFLTTGEEQDLLYSDLMGTRASMTDVKRIHRACRGEPLPKFEVNFRATEHGSAYFGMMADAIALCGYKGWVILIDEVELIGRLGKVGRLQAYVNLNWLLNWSKTLPYPIYTLGVVASSLRNDVWFSGTSTPSTKNDRTQIPELAAERADKFGVNAEAEMKAFFDRAISAECPTIKPLDQSDLLTLL